MAQVNEIRLVLCWHAKQLDAIVKLRVRKEKLLISYPQTPNSHQLTHCKRLFDIINLERFETGTFMETILCVHTSSLIQILIENKNAPFHPALISIQTTSRILSLIYKLSPECLSKKKHPCTRRQHKALAWE